MFRLFHLIICLFICISLANSLQGQQPAAIQLTVKDGLPDMEVYDLMQDSKGYMWIATNSGVCRYDGENFQYYFSSQQKGRSFTNVQEDRTGRIWMRNFNNQFFYVHGDSLQILPIPDSIKIIKYSRYFIDKINNQLYLGGRYLYKYDLKHKDWATIPLTESIDTSKGIGKWVDIYGDQEGYIWVIGYHDVFCLKNNKLVKDKMPNCCDERLRNTVVWNKKMYSLDRDAFIWEEMIPGKCPELLTKQKRNGLNYGLRILNNNSLWGITTRGAVLLKGDEPVNELFPEYAISDIIQDYEGNWWLSTLQKGVFMIPNSHLISYPNDSLNVGGLSNATELRGQVYLGTTEGSILKVNEQYEIQNKYQYPFVKNIEAIIGVDALNKLYTSVQGKLYLVDPQKSSSNFELQPNTFATVKDFDISGDTLVFASNSGAGIFMIGENGLLSYDTLDESRIAKCIWLERGKKHSIWIGFPQKLLHLNQGEAEAVEYRNQAIIASDIIQHKNGNIIVGTIDRGVLILKDQKVVQQISTKEGLISNYCKVLKIDGNELWIGTENGLQRWNLVTDEWEIFQVENGLLSNNVRDLLLRSNQMMVITDLGITTIPKDYSSKEEVVPYFYLEAVKLLSNDSLLNDAAQLGHAQNSLRVDFSLVSMRNKTNLTFQYRLLGQDSSWLAIEGTQNYVRLLSLLPGSYTFELKLTTASGRESSQPQRFSFVIYPPIWQRWWFLLSAVVLFAGILLLFIRWRIRVQKRQHQVSNRINKLKMQALQSQMNPHFIFNALNAIQHFLAVSDEEAAMIYLSKFARLIRLIFEDSKKEKKAFEEELEFLRLYVDLEQLRFQGKVEVVWSIEENLLEEEIIVPPLLIQPVIENCFKHGLLHKEEGGQLYIELRKDKNNPLLLYCKVEDNGVGRREAAKYTAWRDKSHRSSGISTIEERLKLLNKQLDGIGCSVTITDLENEQGSALGTRVELWLPVQF